MRAAVAALAVGGRLAHAASASRPVRALHLNECPFPPSDAVIEVIRATAPLVNRYPDAQARRLAAVLAARTGVATSCIVFGTGSEELLNLMTLVAVDPGDAVIAAIPAFGRYARSAQLAGGTAIRVPVLADGRNDIASMVAAVTPRTRILYCALPNNPTGWMNDAAEVDLLAQTTPEDVLLVVDEAYHEFARHAGGADVLAAMKRRRGPWVVMRTFSKAYCLAGLRLGYALCSSSDVASSLHRAKTSFNANVLVQEAALAALEDKAHLELVLRSCASERARLDAGCRALGLEPMPTVTNFMSIAMPLPATEVVAAMQERGILISMWGEGGRDDMIRVSLGLADDTDAVLTALAEILAIGPARNKEP